MISRNVAAQLSLLIFLTQPELALVQNRISKRKRQLCWCFPDCLCLWSTVGWEEARCRQVCGSTRSWDGQGGGSIPSWGQRVRLYIHLKRSPDYACSLSSLPKLNVSFSLWIDTFTSATPRLLCSTSTTRSHLKASSSCASTTPTLRRKKKTLRR